MKHFLIFTLKSVCYDSYTYFATALAKALMKARHEVEVFSAAKEPLEAMERYVGSTFDAIFDFNSELPRLKMDDDSYFLDRIKAPFYDIILDHPLYHHDTLKQKISNFHVLCLDENHKEYIKTYYPHILSANVFPMTGEDIAPQDTGYPEKNIDILFSGTYTDYREVEASIDTCPGFLGDLTRKLIAKMQENTSLTQEEALRQLLPDLEEAEIIEETFPLHMQACFLCDTYLRTLKRERLLLHLANEKLPLTVCGNGWRKSPLAEFSHVRIIDDTSFYDTFSLFRQSKITLNLLPEFKNGSHDRVYSAMLNHSLCLTDKSPYLEKEFQDGREICFYNMQDLEGVSQRIWELLSCEELLVDITEKGYVRAKERHCWRDRVEYLLKSLF